MSKAFIPDDKACDNCHKLLRDYPQFYDASVGLYGGTWAWLCKPCFQRLGCRLGVGKGQEYDSKTKEKLRG